MREIDKKKFILIYLVPSISIYGVIYLYPIIKGFYTAFFRWTGLTSGMTFIGFENFIKMFKDEVIVKVVTNTIQLLILITLVTVVLALFFAVIITRRNYAESNVYRVIFFLPNVLSIVVVAIIWMFIFNPTMGTLNSILRLIGLGSLERAWLGEPQTALYALVAPAVWMYMGFYMILFIASIKNIPPTYYEASKIDGANEVKQFFNITLPMIWESLKIAVTYLFIQSVNFTFPLVQISTNGGPNRSTEVLATYLYEKAFRDSDFGYATAIGLSMFFMLIVFAALAQKLMKRENIEF